MDCRFWVVGAGRWIMDCATSPRRRQVQGGPKSKAEASARRQQVQGSDKCKGATSPRRCQVQGGGKSNKLKAGKVQDNGKPKATESPRWRQVQGGDKGRGRHRTGYMLKNIDSTDAFFLCCWAAYRAIVANHTQQNKRLLFYVSEPHVKTRMFSRALGASLLEMAVLPDHRFSNKPGWQWNGKHIGFKSKVWAQPQSRC